MLLKIIKTMNCPPDIHTICIFRFIQCISTIKLFKSRVNHCLIANHKKVCDISINKIVLILMHCKLYYICNLYGYLIIDLYWKIVVVLATYILGSKLYFNKNNKENNEYIMWIHTINKCTNVIVIDDLMKFFSNYINICTFNSLRCVNNTL